MGAGYSADFSQPSKKVAYSWFAAICMPTRNTRFCPLQRPLLLQVNFGIGKCTPRRLHSMRRLQDWEKLKKYVPIHKQGDVCPNGVPALVERDNNGDDSDSE